MVVRMGEEDQTMSFELVAKKAWQGRSHLESCSRQLYNSLSLPLLGVFHTLLQSCWYWKSILSPSSIIDRVVLHVNRNSRRPPFNSSLFLSARGQACLLDVRLSLLLLHVLISLNSRSYLYLCTCPASHAVQPWQRQFQNAINYRVSDHRFKRLKLQPHLPVIITQLSITRHQPKLNLDQRLRRVGPNAIFDQSYWLGNLRTWWVVVFGTL